MSDLINEIKEDIKQEQLYNFLKKHTKTIIICVVVFIVALSASLWYKDYQLSKVHKEGSEYLTAINKMRAENVNEAIAQMESMRSGDTNYAALASLNVASYSVYNKDFSKAMQLFEEVSGNSSYSPYLRDLAKLSSIQVGYEAKIHDDSATIKALESYVADKQTFKYTAQEMLVGLYLKNNQMDKAKIIIDALTTDLSVPASISHRLEQYSALLK